MRAESNIIPSELYIEPLGNSVRLRFCVNVRENEEDAELRYVYDEYTVEVAKRKGLEETVRENIEKWSEFARASEEKRFADAVREKRGRLLSDSDWTQGADSPLSEDRRRAWAEYRAELRDITEQAGFPYSVTFPKKPV